ncbi:MAG: BamA/TamA family outer membrane protein, partial [Verrucomicrobia bacterium]|nr:BamA/TamA family outer membrane protein [Verrucomicrobiota bacterium]
TRIYSPDRLKSGTQNLVESLHRLGYENASATVTRLDVNHKTGAVEVVIEVNEGPISIIRHVRESVFWEQSGEPENVEHEIDQAPYSLFWQQDFIRNLRNSYYAQGYAETDIKVDKIERTPEDGTNWVNLFLEVRTGTKVFLGEVTFEGHEKTKESLIRSRIKMEPAQPLNRIQAEQGRYSLSRLGVFESVDLAFEKNKPHRWDVRYDLEEAKTTDLSLLFGFGSYELLRGGFILSQRNIWGLAHSSKLQAYQSFKSTSGEYIYTMPEFIGKDIDVFINPKYLRREEVSFLREEYGGSIGAQKFFSKINSDVGLRYSFDILNAREIEGAPDIGVTRAEVAAWTINIKHDRRNNPLYPTRGYRVSSKLEVASSLFGGQVDYERVELDGSFHKGFGGGRFLHLGLTHGVVITQGDPATDIPVNKRFFPGGENSIRGYQEGKAAPRNNNGRITGAETYTLGNVELEQALTPAWSIIGFVDALGQSRLIDDYPSNEFLISAGGGVRWKTVVGPVRLEYGHNLNPRADDPSGTIHFSIGFPF